MPGTPPHRLQPSTHRWIAEGVHESDLRIALVASSSWSHAFLCDKTWRLRPDTPADRSIYEDMVEGAYERLRARPLVELEESGQQEVLNWYVLFGAMQHLDRTPKWSTLIETNVFNSNKAFAIYPTEDSTTPSKAPNRSSGW